MAKGCLEAVGRLIGSPPPGYTIEVDEARDTVVIRCEQRKTAVAPALPAVGLVLMLPFLALAVRAAFRVAGTRELAFLCCWSGIWTLFCLTLANLLAWNLLRPDGIRVGTRGAGRNPEAVRLATALVRGKGRSRGSA